LLALLLGGLCAGCAVVTVVSTAVSVTAGVVGVAADAAIGTAKFAGKGVGKAADAVLGEDEIPPIKAAAPESIQP
jgi:hypothetical protein